jgi:putative membrane fusion protein
VRLEREYNNRKNNHRKRKRRPPNKGLGIGTFVYFLIFIYLVYTIISFYLKKEINYYSAEKGFIYNAQIFDGIILRNETVINSEKDGRISFFVPEGDKINIGSLVCSIDTNGDFTNEIQKNINYINNKLAYSNNCNNHISIKKSLYTYAINYNNNDFKSIYKLKTTLKDNLLNITQSMYINNSVDIKSLLKDKKLLESQISSNVNLINAIKSGVISYKIDGYEKFDIDSLDCKTLFKYEGEEIYTAKEDKVQQKKPLFKIIDNDKWYIVANMNKSLLEYIQDKQHLRINIIDKDTVVNTKIAKVIDDNKEKYILLEIDRYFNQYLSNRQVKFEVVYDEYRGIKIPQDSIIEKDFVVLPKGCITQRGNSIGVLKKTFGKEYVGGESVEFIKLKFYYKDENNYYLPISQEGFQINDILVHETNGNYTLNEKKALQGVYIINKGYTAFKLVEEVYSSDNYIIAKPSTPYGIRIYDRIISKPKDIVEDTVIY